MHKKYIGLIVDGYWKVILRKSKNNYTLENVYNGTQVTINYDTLLNIINGKSNVAKQIRRKIPKENWKW